jgi:hypothetical protein
MMNSPEAPPVRYIPQADDIEKVFHVADLVADGHTTSAEIAEAMGVVSRQGFYYTTAAEILGIVDRDEESHEFYLTRDGTRYVSANDKATVRRNLVYKLPLMKEIAQSFGIDRIKRPVNESLLDVTAIQAVIQKLTNYSEDTSWRRACTIRAWLRDA